MRDFERRRGEGHLHVFVLDRKKSLLPFLLSFWLLLSIVPDLDGLTGRWKLLHCNNKAWEETMRKTK